MQLREQLERQESARTEQTPYIIMVSYQAHAPMSDDSMPALLLLSLVKANPCTLVRAELAVCHD